MWSLALTYQVMTLWRSNPSLLQRKACRVLAGNTQQLQCHRVKKEEEEEGDDD